ncbi:MAG: glycosyltransferase family 2 protein [Verrucomicrobiales bacterium]
MAAFSVRTRFPSAPHLEHPGKVASPGARLRAGAWYPRLGTLRRGRRLHRQACPACAGECAARDPRIRLAFRESSGHIVAATNTALESARGDFVIHFDHDDELRPHALFCVAREIAAHPEVDLLYSDEDHLDEAGRRYGPYFKPDFNYDLLLSQNVICHLGAYRTALVREVGGFRPGTEGAQDWDLALRVVAASRPERIRHIPRILYHWRSIPGSTARGVQEKPYTVEAGRAAVQAHLEQTGQAFDAVTVTPSGRVRIQWSLPDPAPPVTIIIPTRNFAHLLRICVESVLAKTDYPRFEILIVDNDSDEPETLSYLAGLADEPRIRVLPVPGPFNYSLLNNRAVEATPHPVLCLLNNDIEILDGGWLREMVSQAIRPEVGAVGARLYYPDGRIQHDGVILGVQGCAGHFNKLLSPSEPGPKSHSDLTRNFSAVTAACLVVERSKYLEVRGLDEGTFAVAFNDVDFCLKLFAAGYRNLRTPFAELIHHESASRGEAEKTQAGLKRAMKETISLDAKWHDLLEFDPAYNPNLTLSDEDGSIAFPPRLEAAKLAFAPAQ